MLLKGKTIIWFMFYGFLTKAWKFEIFAEGFLVTIIFGIITETNNDADLIFIAVWQQMIGFSNMADVFDLDGGP